MVKRSFFWVGFVVLSLGAVVFAYTYFSQAFPIVTLDLKMDRAAALEQASSLAQKYEWGPEDYQQAASFDLDSSVQTYVELEVGGTEAFAKMLGEGLYSPYAWTVRHFKELEVNETSIRFTPAGVPYEFRQYFSEDAPGAVLEEAEALEIAEHAATGDWDIDLGGFDLIDTQVENRPGGRRDYTFVYERPDIRVGEGRYRMDLTIAGDRFAGINHYIKVPEAFSRRYQEMRASNDTIAVGAAFAMGLLYLVGGCIFGLFFLLRKRWVVWGKPLQWGALIGGLLFLANINEMPLLWMTYDTAVSSQGFLLRRIAEAFGQAIGMGLLLALSFMAAESLTRKAFPNHIQLWRVWAPGTGSSKAILGRTVAGYLLVSLFFAYEVILYFVSTRYLGWWSPSEALFHPDTLATYLPWLTSIANSLQAGFWEECLFRAVPIAGAALLGQRFGRKNWWIVGAFILQALIFGAGHANYPAQPAYARLVELIIPSLFFAALYLVWGLLPAIVLHFAFDVVWFALPVFVADSPGNWIDRLLVIVLTLVPLWIVLLARFRQGRWTEVPAADLNGSWEPPPLPERSEAAVLPEAPASVSSRTRAVVLAGGALGLVAWLALGQFTNDSEPIEITRSEAMSRASTVLNQKGFALGPEWRTLPTVEAPLNENDRFIWQEGGEEVYHQLLGTFLGSAYWDIRIAKFEGDVAERAEEFKVSLNGKGEVNQFVHNLPEAREGPTLSQEEAKALADGALKERFNLDAALLTLVSSEPSKKPNRQDWLFTYADRNAYPLEKGEARLDVRVSGDEVTDAFRYIHVPEDWLRQERSKRSITTIIEYGSQMVFIALLLTGAVLAIVSWSRKKYHRKAFLFSASLLFLLGLASAALNWPTLMARLSTAQPLNLQLGTFVIATFIAALFTGGTVGLVVGLCHFWHESRPVGTLKDSILNGLAMGLFAAGILNCVGYLTPDLGPTWASYSAAGTFIPSLAAGVSSLSSFVTRTATLLLLFGLISHLTRLWSSRKPLGIAIFLLVGLAVAASSGIESIGSWLIGGFAAALALGLAYYFVFRLDTAAIPATAAALGGLGIIREMVLSAYPGALAGNLIGLTLILLASVLWIRALHQRAGEVP